jgi:long-subunit acyl-CoA synthetase (AMP-forming)
MSQTIPRVFEQAARQRGDADAMRYKSGGEWLPISWNGYREAVWRVAGGFIKLGLEPGQGVAILGFNRPEWFISDIAAIVAGGLPAGIYTTSTPEQCQYVAHHCEAAVVVVEHAEQLAKILAVRNHLPHLKAIVMMEGHSDEPGVHGWQELLELGDRVAESEIEARIAAQQPNSAATLIYTSGTTGPPKAVMLSHHNLVWTSRRVLDFLELQPGDQFLSYLPLSHIAEQMVSLHGPLQVGGCSWFAESIEQLAANMREVRPHIFFGVPRVWEKIQAAIVAAGAQNPPLKRRISAWARSIGMRAGYADQRGESAPLFTPLADKLVFSKVRQKLGLDRARICACSAAPITLDTLEFFLSLGIPILEVYGMSEVTGPGTMSLRKRYRTGKAGFAIPGTELEIADDGEILMRGPHVFLGYYKDEAATRETLDEDGWIHSGDIGELDDDGFLKVTDRKKELIITSGGKNVAPAPIEAKLKSIAGVTAAVVVGDGRKYLAALLTLDPDLLPEIAAAAGSPATDLETASTCPRMQAHLEAQVEDVNRTLASYETIKRFALLTGQFTPEGGELTPTMKLRRRVIHERYGTEIESLYEA